MVKLTGKKCAVIVCTVMLLCINCVLPSALAADDDNVIVEINTNAMYDIKDYGPEFVYDYIAPDASNDERIAVLENIKRTSDEVCNGIDDEYEKIRALESYVSNLIAYDHDAAHNDVSFDTICLKNVIERNRTTCAGFSNLFASLAQAQGLYCVNIRGSAPDRELGITIDNLADDNTPINHEWTAVWCSAESRWVYIDCTWDSLSRYENGEFSMRPAVTTYFDPDIELISLNHKADSVIYRDFFGSESEYFADKMDFAIEPTLSAVTTTASESETAVTTAVTTVTATTTQTSVSIVTSVSLETKYDGDEKKDNTVPLVFFVSGCAVLVIAVVYVNLKSKNKK